MEVRWGVSDFRQWLWVVVVGEWGVRVHACMCNSHRQDPSDKAWSVWSQVQREWVRLGRRVNEARGRKEEKKGGGEGGREDEGAACSSLIPSNIPLDDRGWSKER